MFSEYLTKSFVHDFSQLVLFSPLRKTN